MSRLCEIGGCDKRHLSRGWCEMHYARWYKHGSPLTVYPRGYRGEPIDRFMRYVQKTDDCWDWTGAKDSTGYGRFAWGDDDLGKNCKTKAAHIFSYLHFKGEYDRNLVIDHICNNTTCVNPDHLRPLTHCMNLLRGHLLRAVADGTSLNEIMALVGEAFNNE